MIGFARAGRMSELRRRGRLPVVLAALAALAVVLAATTSASAKPQRATATGDLVAMLLPDAKAYRWSHQDGPFFAAAMKKLAPGAKVQLFYGKGDPATQLSQAENALAKGAKVLVVGAQDSVAAAQIVNAAAAQDVPVVAYARPILNSPVKYFVTSDVAQMGEIQGKWIAQNTKEGDKIAIISGARNDANALIIHKANMKHLAPLFKSGKRKLVADSYTPNWDPARAQAQMEQILTKNDNDIDAVLAANDGMAGGVIAALQAQGLAGKVKVTGLDASAAGLQLLLAGKQSMTILISIKSVANQAAQIAAALVNGTKPPAKLFVATTSNGKFKVPTTASAVKLITKNNVIDVITDGNLTKAQVCKGVPKGTGPC